MAKKEKEAAEKHLKASLPKKRASPNREQQQSARLVSASSELQHRRLPACVIMGSKGLALEPGAQANYISCGLGKKCLSGTDNLESSDS